MIFQISEEIFDIVFFLEPRRCCNRLKNRLRLRYDAFILILWVSCLDFEIESQPADSCVPVVKLRKRMCTCISQPHSKVYSLTFYFSVFLGRWKKRQLNHGRVSFSSSERHETDSTTMRPSRDDVREMHRIKPFKLNVTAIDHDSSLGEDKPSKYRIIQTQQFNVQSDTAIKSSYTEKSTFVVLPLLSLPPAHIYAPMKNKIGFNFINETPSQPFAASSHHHFFFTY